MARNRKDVGRKRGGRRKRPVGWRGEPERHDLARQGVKTTPPHFGQVFRAGGYWKAKPGERFNVAGYVRGRWMFGFAVKRADGDWSFLRDHGSPEETVVLRPRHIKIYGRSPLWEDLDGA